MKIDILTLFPNMFDGFLNESIVKRAIDKELVEINPINIRDYSKNKHKKVDDTPYGGGAGMVLMCQPIFDAVKDLQKKETKVILMTPQGVTFNQKIAYNLSKEKHLIFICGHYEGFDERIRTLCDMEISIGDYVLTGGELPSMVIADATVRLVEGVIEDESHEKDSFNNGLLDYPSYTKPQEFEGLSVPDVLISGHHENIEKWRKEESIKKTEEKRPDLLQKNNHLNYVVTKNKNGETAYIEYESLKGYDINPKNNAKRDDVINVTKMVIIEPTFIEKIAKMNIEKRIQQLLKNLLIVEEDADDDISVMVLGEADRLRSIVLKNYEKVLQKEYIDAVVKRIDFVVKEVKIKKEKKKAEEVIEKSGKSR